MLKRKYGDRSEWKRILKRKYAQTYIDTKEFKGYITLLSTEKVTEPLFVQYANKNVCIVDDGYMWLQQFPLDKKHAVTTMFDSNGEIVQWYIDICRENGLNNSIPWMDDLFLDIILLPTGEMFVVDDDELEKALLDGVIDQSLYDSAWKEANCLTESILTKTFHLPHLSNEHKEVLLGKLR